MDLSRPLSALTPTLEADVLAVLAGAESHFTGEQVAKLVGDASPSGVRKALERLVATGLVLRETAGKAYLYRLNREHLAAQHVVALSQLRREFDRRIGDLVSKWDVPAEAVILFGSAARREMRADSDIDLLVIGPSDDPPGRWHEQTEELADRVTAWTGNDVRILEMSADEVYDAFEHEEPLVEDLRRDGQVLHGNRSYLRKMAAGNRKVGR